MNHREKQDEVRQNLVDDPVRWHEPLSNVRNLELRNNSTQQRMFEKKVLRFAKALEKLPGGDRIARSHVLKDID